VLLVQTLESGISQTLQNHRTKIDKSTQNSFSIAFELQKDGEESEKCEKRLGGKEARTRKSIFCHDHVSS